MKRRDERMQAHFDNTTWTKRDKPPEDWNKPLPEWMVKRDEHSYLALKRQEELDEEEQAKVDEATNQSPNGVAANARTTPKTESLCSIM